MSIGVELKPTQEKYDTYFNKSRMYLVEVKATKVIQKEGIVLEKRRPCHVKFFLATP